MSYFSWRLGETSCGHLRTDICSAPFPWLSSLVQWKCRACVISNFPFNNNVSSYFCHTPHCRERFTVFK